MSEVNEVKAGNIKIGGNNPLVLIAGPCVIEDHPWFLGCQFHPEFKSRPLDPQPLFSAFIAAACEKKR